MNDRHVYTLKAFITIATSTSSRPASYIVNITEGSLEQNNTLGKEELPTSQLATRVAVAVAMAKT